MIAVTQEQLERALLPKVHWDSVLDNIPDKCTHKKYLTTYLQNLAGNIQDGKGLLFYGDYATGKSAAAAIIAKAALALGNTVLYLPCPKLPDLLYKDALFEDGTTYRRRMSQVDLLILDELILYGDNRDNLLEVVIRDRVADKKSFIITTNHAPTFIQSKAPALFSPLKESVFGVSFSGINYRDQIAAAISTQYKK